MSEQSDPPKKGLREMIARLGRVYGSIFEMAWSAAPARSALLLFFFIVLGVTGAVTAFLSRFVVDGVVEGDGDRALLYGVIYLAVSSGMTVLNDLMQLLQTDLADRIVHEVDIRLMEVAAGAPGLDHLERSEFADRIKQVRERQWVPANLLQSMSSVAYVVIGLLAAGILLGMIHPILTLLPVVMLPSAALQFRSFRKRWRQFDQVAPEQRLADHLLKLTVQPTGAKEIRLFGLRSHLMGEHRRLSDHYVSQMFRARLKQSAGSTLGGAMYGLSITAGIAFIGYLALEGRATAGEVVLGVLVARLALANVEVAAEMVARIAEMAFMGEKYLWLLRYEPAVTVRAVGDASPAPEKIAHGITFEGVAFGYPGTEREVLHDVNLFIPASSTVALVGENGAGKSSLVKLLARFYDPTEGRVLVDGVDLRDIDLAEWRARMSTAFQDFVRFQLVAREAVGVGQLGRVDDHDRVGAAVKFAGADRIVAKLPSGLDTQLGRQFKDGHDLSEGEWQRVALARGSMPDEPALIVLDEPTASLDARAEHEVFVRFAEMARPGAGLKPITVLVSHRFSTVRMADLIVVLHDGRIEEIGSHDDLIARGGRYAELFRMQASRYD